MNARLLAALAVALLWGSLSAESAQAQGPFRPWHGQYYHSMYGAPVAQVVPPNAELQTKYQWGVTGTSVVPIRPKFRRQYWGEGGGMVAYPTPHWPSHTDQFGVYYIRGPW